MHEYRVGQVCVNLCRSKLFLCRDHAPSNHPDYRVPVINPFKLLPYQPLVPEIHRIDAAVGPLLKQLVPPTVKIIFNDKFEPWRK